MDAVTASPRTPRSARSNFDVPFLPGNGVHSPAKWKPQTLNYGPGGGRVLSSTGKGMMSKLDMSILNTVQDPFYRYNMSARSITHDERDAFKESARNTYRPAVPPAWLHHDRQVLKFDAYIQEPVHENPTETFRIRACIIYFYLEDGTMMVSEPKVENSGIPQGPFLKRHRFPKPEELGGGVYAAEDLRVDEVVSLYSRSFYIIGCDEFTRSFVEQSFGVAMPENMDPPMDAFRLAEMEEPPEVLAARGADLAEIKEYMNISSGGNRRNAKLEQYLENDRKVLRFRCYWDDTSNYGTRWYFTLHYYLADDTIELLDNPTRNCGRDTYPTFWRRAPLRKNPYMTAAPGMMEPEPILYKPVDLIVGEEIDVMGRRIFLYDCDAFTRDFYMTYMDQEQGSIPIPNPPTVHVALSHPPHNGFGSEEDSLGNCLRLTPRPPRRDIKKLMLQSDRVMRFRAKLVNCLQEDVKRRFVVAMYPANNEVGVWEAKHRNSGHAEGKWAAKGKKRNPATGDWFKPSDFFIGAVLEINSNPFELLGADENALKYMEDDADQFPYADAGLVVAKLRGLRSKLVQVSNGNVSCRELKRLAQENGISLVEHELVTLARAFGNSRSSSADLSIPTAALVAAME